MAISPSTISAAALEKYILPRNEGETQRLDLQHAYLTASITKGRLIYDNDFQIEPGSRVLDAGTGTGPWILDLSKEVPDSVELIGSDISPALFPKSFPNNAKFIEASTTDLPESWTGSFDFVNQRMLMAGFIVHDWEIAISEIFRVLKPGGMAQFVEMTVPYPSGDGVQASERMANLLGAIWQKRGYLCNASEEILKMMKAAGFIDIQKDINGGPLGSSWGEIGKIGAQNLRAAHRATGAIVMAEGGMGQISSLEDFHALVDAEEEEWNNNVGFHYNYAVITGRKPS